MYLHLQRYIYPFFIYNETKFSDSFRMQIRNTIHESPIQRNSR